MSSPSQIKMQATTSSYDMKNSAGCVWCQQDIFYSIFSFSGQILPSYFLHLSLNSTIYDLTQYVVIDQSGNDKCVSQK